MDPHRPDPDEPGDTYGRALRDRIVEDARRQARDWVNRTEEARVTPRLVIGLAIMTAGLVLALDSLGVLDGSVVFRFWPIVLVAVGIVKWTSPPHQAQAGFVWIVAGVGFLLVTLGQMPFSRLWAVLLFFVGANIAWRALRPPIPRSAAHPSESFDMMAILGGCNTVAPPPGAAGHLGSFRGGRAMAVMGSCQIDLRHATIADGQEAAIDAFAMWGGIEIRVPDDWEVVNRGSAFLGGFESKARPLAGTSKRLIVTGTVIMGGVEVKN
jgi:predicted membrane protein